MDPTATPHPRGLGEQPADRRPRSPSAARAVGALAFLAWATHVLVMWIGYGSRPAEALWACHVAPLLLALGCALLDVRVTSVAITWIVLGTPIWLGDLVATGTLPAPTPVLVHAGVLAIALAGVRALGWDRHAWWRASLALAALAIATRLVPAAERDDVNLVFRVWPGLEPIFATTLAFHAFLALAIPPAFFVISRAMERLAAR